MSDKSKLTRTSAKVLRLIAGGHTYEQILHECPDATYTDVFGAAAEALELLGVPGDSKSRLDEVRREHPRVYEKWTDEEDSKLVAMFKSSVSPAEMAGKLQRRELGVMARLVKLGLLAESDVPALAELREKRKQRKHHD